jgi:thiol-disulfide isomerase/thioredoxin
MNFLRINSMKNKNIILIVAFVFTSIIGAGELYSQHQVDDSHPLAPLIKKLNEKQKVLKGITPPSEFTDTMVKDTCENELTFGEILSRYRGKVIYLDIWDITCGPCKIAMQYSQILKSKLQDCDVEFVYLSVFPIKDNLKKIFTLTGTNKNHFVLGKSVKSKLLTYLEVDWIPIYMIFDKEGKIYSINEERPTADVESGMSKLEKTIRELGSK